MAGLYSSKASVLRESLLDFRDFLDRKSALIWTFGDIEAHWYVLYNFVFIKMLKKIMYN